MIPYWLNRYSDLGSIRLLPCGGANKIAFGDHAEAVRVDDKPSLAFWVCMSATKLTRILAGICCHLSTPLEGTFNKHLSLALFNTRRRAAQMRHES